MSSRAQNLVPNAGFEEYDECLVTTGFQLGDRPLHWYSWFNSPDYFNACAGALNDVDTLMDVPLNGFTFQYAWEGDAYVGLYSYSGVMDNYREYVGVQLLEPLVVGCEYRLRFRANPACNGTYWFDEGGGVCNNLGMLFTMTSNAWTAPFPWPPGPTFGLRNYAHLHVLEPIVDTLLWTVVEGTFVADSAYAHLVLGNFFSDAQTLGYPIGDSDLDLAYYMIDGVEVVPLDNTCHVVGINGPTNVGGPVLAANAAGIQISWPGTSFIAELLDGAGRSLIQGRHSIGDEMRFETPLAAGMYVAKVYAGARQEVFKFVIME